MSVMVIVNDNAPSTTARQQQCVVGLAVIVTLSASMLHGYGSAHGYGYDKGWGGGKGLAM